MKKFIALFLVFSVIIFYRNLYAKERHGEDLLVQKSDGQQIRGKLIAVKQNSLLLKEFQSGADVNVEVNDIHSITILKKSKFWQGAGSGLLMSASTGGVVALSTYGSHSDSFQIFSPGYVALVSGIAAGLLGASLGGGIGDALGKDRVIQFEGMSENTIKANLVELHKKARVPNFQ